jgi:hypothetical protein
MTGDAKGEYRGLAYRNDAELQAWLARRPREAALEPELPIIDPHHHFWDTPQRGRYLLPELLADIGGGHNIISTVFLECRSMYKKDGPAEMAPVGEVEFVNGIAAMSASSGYGPCRVAEGIVGHADLTLGARVREVLEAEIRWAAGAFAESATGCRGTSTKRSRNTRPVSCRRISCAIPSSARGSLSSRRWGSASNRGSTIRNCRTRSTSPVTFPIRRSS